jgi:hypothetical protein
MGEQVPRGRKNEDGSVDVWVGLRRLHFPGGGGRPIVTEDDPPPFDAVGMPGEVLVDVGDPVTMVSYDGWYARLTASGVATNRTRARRHLRWIFRRTFGRHGS